MEGLIPVIILMIISALFKNKKPSEKEPANKRTNSAPQPKPVSQNPFKDLADFAKEFTKDQQMKMKEVPPAVKDIPVVQERMEREQKRDQGEARSSGRLSVFQEKNPERQAAKPLVNSVIPSSKEELIKSIIFAEVLAPPKSKR